MTYASNWSREARSAMSALNHVDMTAVRTAVSLLCGRMPEVGGTVRVEGTSLEIGYEIQPKKVLGILHVRIRKSESEK